MSSASASASACCRPLNDDDDDGDGEVLRIAFVGNSILYFNDCPRVLESMLLCGSGGVSSVVQDSCLRGGTSLTELWTQGNGMSSKFAPTSVPQDDNGRKPKPYDIGAPSVQALLWLHHGWDFVIMNDFTQGPARMEKRTESKLMLERCYAPLLRKCGAIPIVLQTAAYRKPVRNTTDLGTVPEWTERLEEGCQEYVDVLADALPASQTPRLAPVGNAYLQIYNNDYDLWEKLFYTDDFHPSPHGTWLQVCVLYCIVTDEAPPSKYYSPDVIWTRCRYMQRPNREPSPLPTVEEAETLRQYACNVCGVSPTTQSSL